MSYFFYDTFDEITTWLDSHDVKNYHLIKNKEYGFVVDVHASVNLSLKKLETIPVKFNEIRGSVLGQKIEFNVSNNLLSSLAGCPEIVHGNFNCSKNRLKNLKFAPSKVDGFYCFYNELDNLEGSPREIHGDFYADCSELKSLRGCPEKIHGVFCCSNNLLQDLMDFPQMVSSYCELHTNNLNGFEKITDFKQLFQEHQRQNRPIILNEKLQVQLNKKNIKTPKIKI